MWAAVSVVPLGNPAAVTLKSAVAAVMVPAASFVRLNVMVAVPDPSRSAFDTGGTSFAGNKAAVNFVGRAVGVVGVSFLSHAANVRPSEATRRTETKRFMVGLLKMIRKTSERG